MALFLNWALALYAMVTDRDSKIISEYDQEIPQSQTAVNPMAPRGRVKKTSSVSKYKEKHIEIVCVYVLNYRRG